MVEPDVLLELPEDERAAFKEPMGPVYTDPERLLADAGEPILAVGDVVTGHLVAAGRQPDVALVDGRTQRGAIDESVRDRLDDVVDLDVLDDPDLAVSNPPATLTRELLSALREAVDAADPTVVLVDGEEDLAAVPAVLVAPDGAAVVYGQPGEGMVLVEVDGTARTEARALFERLAGDHDVARALLGI